MGSDFWEEVSFVQRSVNRERILRLLVDAGRPMTPTELGEETGVVVKTASRAVRSMVGRGLVECVNPDAPRDRRYRPTDRGREVWMKVQELEDDRRRPGEFAESGLEYSVGEVPGELQEDASYLQASRNRKAVLEALASADIPLTPSELAEDIGSGFNSASRAVRQLAERDLARCVNPGSEKYRRYELSERGERIHRAMSSR